MVKLFNNLNALQSVKIRDRNNTYYDMFIEARKSVTLEGYQVTQDIFNKVKSGLLLDLSKSFIETPKPTLVVDEVPVESSKNLEDSSTYVENKSSITTNSDTVTTSEVSSNHQELYVDEPQTEHKDIYVCDICGNEYASEKGLAMHKARSHK